MKIEAISKATILAVLACAAFTLYADGEGWQSRLPMQDTFVNYNARGTASGDSTFLIVGNGRESCLMFNVSGLENATAVRIALCVVQGAGADSNTGEYYVQPLFLRVMRHRCWNEYELTWNSLPAGEFPSVPSPILPKDDPTVAAYVENANQAVGTWVYADVTAAAKAAAADDGILALHVYTPWGNGGGGKDPLAFYSKEYAADASLRTRLEWQGAENATELPLLQTTKEDTFLRGGNYKSSVLGNEEYITVSRDSSGFSDFTREGLLKFDLSGFSGRTVSSAELRLRMYDSTTYAGKLVEFRLIDDSSWSEAAANGNNLPNGITPPDSWPEETPANAIRVVPPGPGTYMTVELAPLVNQALAAGRTEMSLLVTRQDANYFIFYTKEHAEATKRPRLLILLKDEPVSATTRRPIQETIVSGYDSTTMDTAYYAGEFTNYFRIGCNADNKVLYGVALFDPSKLEDAAFVRLRVNAKSGLPAGNGILRVAAWTTDAWNETNLTWNTTGPWLPKPVSVADGTELPGETANVFLSQPKQNNPWFEVDVTAAARAAAQAGRMLSLGLFSNVAWIQFYKGASDYPDVLVFPDPDATFGNKVTCSLGESNGKPALRLEWSPSPVAGATYTVERRKGDTWVMVASGLAEPTCLDSKAEPYVEHAYRITATTEGTSESVVKSVTLVPTVKVFACADTYVRNGGNANTSFGTDTMLVHKYEGVDTVGGVREAFYRFDLSEMPTDFNSATLKLYPIGDDGGDIANARFELFEYPDFEWTDMTAPTWNDVFGNSYATPKARADQPDEKRMAENLLGTYLCNEHGRILADVPVVFDVTAAIKDAKTTGRSHITLHSATFSNSGWNFGIISRERSQGVSCAAQIVFALKNWTVSGTVIMVR